MSHTIFVHNRSGQEQRFYVHGWNNNADLVVGPSQKASIDAPDGSSGAIIAVHDGHEGEQAEITKNGFGGNDFFDISYIVGIGGNLTIKQTDSGDFKGHPTFMRACNEKWQALDQGAKDQIAGFVHLDGDRVVRLDRPASTRDFEKFVRSFADGYGYIDHGAWLDDQGNPSDNYQSKAGNGNKDILVTYSDIDATPGEGTLQGVGSTYTIQAGDTFWSIAQARGLSVEEIQRVNPGVDAGKLQVGQVINLPTRNAPRERARNAPQAQLQVQSEGDADKGAGIELTNKGSNADTYFFYDNFWNGDGTAGANFDKPLTNVTVDPNQTTFVPLPLTFKGRVQRGSHIPATWVEFQIQASNDGKAHGDISVQQGNDGPAVIRSTDGSGQENGFTEWVNAPDGAYRQREDGKRVIDTTVGNWMGGPNQQAIDAQMFLQGKVYVVGGTGVPDVASGSNRFAVDFY